MKGAICMGVSTNIDKNRHVSQTSLNNALEATAKREQYDANAKVILSHKAILAWILKTCTNEFKDFTISFIEHQCIEGSPDIGKAALHQNTVDADARIDGLDTETSSAAESRNTFDIRFSARVPDSEQPINLFINIEFQKDKVNYPIAKRGIYYCCRMISAQYGTVFIHSEYGKLRKVYSIWICAKDSSEQMDTIVSYRLTPETIHGRPKYPEPKVYDLINTTIIGLSPDFPESKSEIIRLLGAIFMPKYTLEEKQKCLEEDFKIPMNNEMEEAMKEMSSFCDFYVEYGEARGEIKGAICVYHNEMKLPDDIIIKKIKKQYNLSQEEAENYVKQTLCLQEV